MNIAVVTGASRGLGEAISEALIAEGYDVIGTSTTGHPTDVVPDMVKLNLNDRHSIQEGAEEIIERADGKIKLLYNNAGYLGHRGNLIDNVEDAIKVMQVNVLGLMELTALLVPHIQENGLIINMSSDAADPNSIKSFNHDAYNVSKASVDMYTRSLADSLAGRRIKVIATDPEWVATDMGGAGAPKRPSEVGEEAHRLIDTYDELVSGAKYVRGKLKS